MHTKCVIIMHAFSNHRPKQHYSITMYHPRFKIGLAMMPMNQCRRPTVTSKEHEPTAVKRDSNDQ